MTLVEATARPLKSSRSRMSEHEFVQWVDGETRAEWVDGEVVVMAPDNIEHARLGLWLLSVVQEFVNARRVGEALGPNFTVRLSALRRRRVPDVLFVSNARRHQLQERHCEGAPDLIMEVVSPDSEARDWREKYVEYRKAGVREYWVIDPMSQHVEVYALSRDRKSYREMDEVDGVIRSRVLRGFYIRTQWLWDRPSVRHVMRDLGVK